MTPWQWNGARWWKVDFHTHTPASSDYGKGRRQAELRERTRREWLLDFMKAGIDCVVVTDHNSGEWIDGLRDELENLSSERPADFRQLHLFPGVEISVQGGIHLLAVLGCEKRTADIHSLLGAVGFRGTRGESDKVTTKSFTEVAEAIGRAGGIPIPAHVDRENGLFKALEGTTLKQALDCGQVYAMEVVDAKSSKPAAYDESKHRWTEVLGSDSHHPSGNAQQRFPGSHFTWVKMGSPELEGLRLALLDGELSVRRSDEERGDPNEHAPEVLERIEVSEARYMGRSEPFILKLNPWLNAIVGGRGTGKSTIIELLRLALRRRDELPESLRPEFEKYGEVYADREDGGLLASEARIQVIYRKNGSQFRVQWSPAGDLEPIQEEVDGKWRRAEGDVRQRFPVRMYSQKQVFELAKTPLALLRIIDEAPDVHQRSWKARWDEEETRFLSLRAKAREIEAGLAEGPGLRGELADVKRKLAIFEQAGHADLLKAFQKRSRQQRLLESWEDGWADTGDRLRTIAGDMVPDPPDETLFDTGSPEDANLYQRASAARQQLDGIRESLEKLAAKADEVLAGWREEKDSSLWKEAVDRAVASYDGLRARLAQEGAGDDPAAYGELVQRRQITERRLESLGERKKQADELRTQAEASLGRLLVLRHELTKRRRNFLRSVLENNQYVRIAVVPYGAHEAAESEFRALLQRDGGGFEKDIGSPDGGGLLGRIFESSGDPTAIEPNLEEVKLQIRQIADGKHGAARLGDRRFATHVGKLPPEALDRLDVWFPEDSLDVQYSTTGDGRSFRSIQEGSPGQRTAALLAFLLSYGEEPLVLDQPEDDLDNHLIYDLIVTQLREVKRHRQILVVTHNANIVVNGDAELVVALAARGGETQKECEGSLQDNRVREAICEVMEGGREAFEQRYRRIALEVRHV